MGVIVTQQPTSINVTGTDLIYTLSSSLATSPQYRFVTDIYESGSGNFITRLKTYPNLYGSAQVNVARELKDQIGYKNTQKILKPEINEEAKDYQIFFGEEYSNSLDEPRFTVTGSYAYDLQVFPGSVEANEGRNFPSSSFNPSRAGLYTVNNPDPRLGGLLSNNPAQQNRYNFTEGVSGQYEVAKMVALPITNDDYGTLSLLKNEGWTIREILVEVVDYEGVVLGSQTLAIPTGASTSDFQGIIDIPAGPLNFILYPGLASAFQNNWSGYYVNVESTTPVNGTGLNQWFVNPENPLVLDHYIQDPTVNWTDKVKSMLPQDACNGYTRFAWTNQYGMWDYYNIYNPERKNTDIKRDTYSRPFERYEDCYAIYDVSNRGERQYMTQYTDKFTIATDFIDEQNANWLTEMFTSNDVYVQNGNQFLPINITNAGYSWNNNTFRNKLFQYEITYEYANQREPR